MSEWDELVFEPDTCPPDGGKRRWKVIACVLAGCVVAGGLVGWRVATRPTWVAASPSPAQVTVSVTVSPTAAPTPSDTPSPSPSDTPSPAPVVVAATTAPPAPPVQAAPATTTAQKPPAKTSQAVAPAPSTSKAAPPPAPAVGKPTISVTSCTQNGRDVAATVSFDTGGSPGTVNISFGSVSAAPVAVQAAFTTASGTGTMPDASPVTCSATITTSGGQGSASRAAG